jgi:hypothetical protein
MVRVTVETVFCAVPVKVTVKLGTSGDTVRVALLVPVVPLKVTVNLHVSPKLRGVPEGQGVSGEAPNSKAASNGAIAGLIRMALSLFPPLGLVIVTVWVCGLEEKSRFEGDTLGVAKAV